MVWTWVGPRNRVLGWGPWFLRGRGNFGEDIARPVLKYQECPASDRYSPPYLVGDSGDVAFHYQFCSSLLIHLQRYGDSVDNIAEEKSCVFALIWMRWLPSAGTCGQQNFAPTTRVDLYKGHKTMGVFVVDMSTQHLLFTFALQLWSVLGQEGRSFSMTDRSALCRRLLFVCSVSRLELPLFHGCCSSRP